MITFELQYEGRYTVKLDGEAIGSVQKVRNAVGSTSGSRIRSGRERTEWKVAGNHGTYPTRKAAVTALMYHRMITKEEQA